MSSHDAWAGIPNLSGQTAAQGEDTRTADPSRFYPPLRGGVIDPVTGRILDVPYCKVYNSVGLAGFGPGSSYIGYNVVVDDNDKMATGSPLLTCRTPGLYAIKGMIWWNNPVFTQWLWLRVIVNGNVVTAPINITTQGINAAFSTAQEGSGFWKAKVGDTIGLYAYTNAACDILGGEYALYMEACFVKSYGSDNQ